MTYKDTLQAVDTLKALNILKIENSQQGAYLKFKCPNPECSGQAAIKAYGDKKNLYYCPSCKASGHIISLTMKIKGISWEAANEFLTTAIGDNKKITTELDIHYELAYHDFIKAKGISEDICRLLEIGVPKGKTMLAGCVAFAIRNDEGIKVAYYGIRMKDGKSVFHKSFNPELYLYNFCNLDLDETVYFTTDIFRCVKEIEEGKQCVCNFALPYLTNMQLELLQSAKFVCLLVEEPLVRGFAVQLAQSHNGFYRFKKM